MMILLQPTTVVCDGEETTLPTVEHPPPKPSPAPAFPGLSLPDYLQTKNPSRKSALRTARGRAQCKIPILVLQTRKLSHCPNLHPPPHLCAPDGSHINHYPRIRVTPQPGFPAEARLNTHQWAGWSTDREKSEIQSINSKTQHRTICPNQHALLCVHSEAAAETTSLE